MRPVGPTNTEYKPINTHRSQSITINQVSHRRETEVYSNMTTYIFHSCRHGWLITRHADGDVPRVHVSKPELRDLKLGEGECAGRSELVG